MARAVVGWQNRLKAAVLSSPLQAASYPLARIVDAHMAKTWRTLGTTGVFFTADFGASVAIDAIGLFATNLTPTATWRIRLDDTVGLNLALWSEEFQKSVWRVPGGGVTANAAVGPFGGMFADRFTEDTSTTFHGVQQAFTKSATPQSYTVSCYVNSSTRWLLLAIGDDVSDPPFLTANYAGVTYDLQTGTIWNQTGRGSGFTWAAETMQHVGGGWYRCSVSVAVGSATQFSAYIISNQTFATTAQPGDGVSFTDLFGAQMGLGATLGSYTYSAGAPGLVFDGDVLDTGDLAANVAPGYRQTVKVLPAALTARYLRIDLADPGLVSTDYFEVGGAFAGPAFRPGRNFSYGRAHGFVDPSVRQRSKGGQLHIDVRDEFRVQEFELKGLSEAEAYEALDIDRQIRLGGNLLFVPDYESAHKNREAIFGPISDASPAVNSALRVWAKRYRIEERL